MESVKANTLAEHVMLVDACIFPIFHGRLCARLVFDSSSLGLSTGMFSCFSGSWAICPSWMCLQWYDESWAHSKCTYWWAQIAHFLQTRWQQGPSASFATVSDSPVVLWDLTLQAPSSFDVMNFVLALVGGGFFRFWPSCSSSCSSQCRQSSALNSGASDQRRQTSACPHAYFPFVLEQCASTFSASVQGACWCLHHPSYRSRAAHLDQHNAPWSIWGSPCVLAD